MRIMNAITLPDDVPVAALQMPAQTRLAITCTLISRDPLFYFNHEDWERTLA